MKTYTVLPFGPSGYGKTLFGYALLQLLLLQSHNSSDSPDSQTLETFVLNNTFDDFVLRYIDNPGLFTSGGQDKELLKDMVNYIKKDEYGINAYFIVLNVHIHRFGTNIQ